MEKEKKVVDFDEIRIKPKTLVISLLLILLVAVFLALFLAYGTKTILGNRIAKTISKVVPYPAAILNYHNFVFENEVEKNLTSLEQFYATQNFSQAGLRIDFTTADGQKRLEIKRKELLQKMVEDKAIKILANERKIIISQDQVDKIVNQKMQELGTTEEVKKNLLRSYGWTIEDFKKQVVLPGMYKDALAVYFNENDANIKQTEDIAKKAKKDLDSGKDFVQVVNLYSSGFSKEKGGELGWVKKSQLLPELQLALFGAEPFENDSIIESSIGFHIIEIENKKKDNNNEDVLLLRQIFIAKYSFADWLVEKMKAMSILLPSREFNWNSESGLVEFTDSILTKFEEEARGKAQGDASIIF